jgi:serine/threonine protein kinase
MRRVVNGYALMDAIGSGLSSVVYRAEKASTGGVFAIKEITMRGRDSEAIGREIEVISSLSHPGIVRLFEYFGKDDNMYIVMELLDMTLLQYINDTGPLPLEEARHLFGRMADVIAFMHKEVGIVHRDLKLENWMLTREGRVKLIDFGLSKHLFDVLSTPCGTIGYMSPEMVRLRSYTDKTDIWSLGTVLYAMLTKHLPFEGPNQRNVHATILHSEPFYAPSLPADVINLLCGMLKKNPEERFGIKEVLQNPWVRNDVAQSLNEARHSHGGSLDRYDLPGDRLVWDGNLPSFIRRRSVSKRLVQPVLRKMPLSDNSDATCSGGRRLSFGQLPTISYVVHKRCNTEVVGPTFVSVSP